MKRSHSAGLLLTSVCAMALAQGARAQATGNPGPAQAAVPVAPAADVPAAPAQLGEVVVTAQRRSERLQDVPVAVSVVSAVALANSNYTGLTNLQLLVPSLQYNANVGGGFQIRGVGTQTINLTTEQDVGVVIDDVIQGIPQLTFAPPSYQALTDVDRVEVLKGPQGTLFGKNSSVGVLQIVTKAPRLGLWSLDGSVEGATHGEYKVQATANAPIGDTLALRVTAFDFHHDGFIKNVYNGDELGGYNQYGVRAKLLWRPTAQFDATLQVDRVHTDDDGNGAWTLRVCGSGFYMYSACGVDRAYGITAGPNNRQLAEDAPTPADTDTTDASLRMNYDFGPATLTSVTAFIDLDQDENVDVDNTPRPILDNDRSVINSKQYTQEFRLSSNGHHFLEYTVGAYYYRLDSTYDSFFAGTYDFEPDSSTTLLSNGFAGTVTGGETVLQTTNESYAVFGQGTLNLTDKLQLLGGVRYTHDDVRAGIHVEPLANVCEFAFAFGGPCHTTSLPSAPQTQDASASNVSGKVTLKYDFTRRINAYATFATGYKGPAISYAALIAPSAVKPETSTEYELGLKSELFERRLVLNGDVFYEKYKNFQADTYVLNAADPSASNFELANAGGLESKGVEVDSTFLVTPELTFTGSVAYIPTRFTDFVIQCQNQFTNPATVGACYSENGASLFNAKGYPLPQAPKVSYNLALDWRHPLANGYVLDAGADWNWRSSTYSVVADVNTIQGGYGVLGANIGFGPAGGAWKFSVFARNLLDQQFVSAIFQTFLDNGGSTGVVRPTAGYSNIPNIESERTIGAKLDFRFGG